VTSPPHRRESAHRGSDPTPIYRRL